MFKLYMILYNILAYCAQPYIWIQLLWNSTKIPLYRQQWLERYSFYNKKKIKSNDIILHAVSLGETLSSKPLIHKLQKHYPNITITLTSMTPSGLEAARQFQLKQQHNIQCVYLPYDLPGSMKRFIKKINPKLVIIMETELWPNLINTLYQYKIPIIIANARLSLHSFLKYKRIKYFLFYIMQRITIIAAQYKDDANRFLELGFKKNQLHIIGNLKFDLNITQDLLKKTLLLKKNWIKKRLTWIASSTHEGEEILLLHAHKILLTKFPDLLMILVPRHPERFINIIKITKKFGLSYIIQSDDFVSTDNVQVIINNTVGNLTTLYGVSDIAFIGGSLIQHGGHNPLEAAVFSIPILTGPYTFNFDNIYNKLYKKYGLTYVTDTASIIYVISILLKNQKKRLYQGTCAYKVFKYNTGATKRLMHIIHENLLN